MLQTRFVAYDRLGARRGIIPNFLEANLTYGLGELSVLTLQYDRKAVNHAYLENEPEIAVEIFQNNAWVETRNGRLKCLSVDADHLEDVPTRRFDFMGIGEMLKGILVYESMGLPVNDEGKVVFANATVGKILNTIIVAAKARGFTGFTHDFTNTLDSSGVAWNKTITISYSIDTNLLNIMDSLRAMGVLDYEWAARVLKVYNADTTMARDLTLGANPIRFAGSGNSSGVDSAPELQDLSSLVSHVVVIGEEGLRWEFPTGTVLPEGRREMVLTYSGVNDQATAATLAAPHILRGQNHLKNTTRQFHLTEETIHQPLLNYVVGDWANVQRGLTFEKMRIFSLNLLINEHGTQGYVMLGDKIDDLLELLYQRIQGLTGGIINENGPPPVDSPRNPTSPIGVIASTSTYPNMVGEHLGSISVGWDHDGKDVKGQPITIKEYDVYYRQLNNTGWALLGTTTAKTLTFSPLPSRMNGGTLITYQVHVVARAVNTRVSAMSGIANAPMVGDTTPPAKPSAPTVTTWLRTVSVKWDGLGRSASNVVVDMPPDLRHVIVWQSLAQDMTSKAKVGVLVGDQTLELGTRTANTTYWYALQAEDNVGNLSDMSTSVSITPTTNVDAASILNKVDAATVTLSNVGSTSILNGAILADKLADNAVTQAKIAAGAVDLTKLNTAANDRINKGINDAETARLAAVAADGKAGTAQTAADAAKAAADAAIASGANLVVDGGFELNGWLTNAAAQFDTAEKRSGLRSMRLIPTNGNVWPTSNWVDGSTGRIYRLEYWIKKSGTDPATSTSFGTVLQSRTTAGGTSTTTSYVPLSMAQTVTDTGYTKLTLDVAVTTPNTVAVRFAPWVKQSTNTYWVDDFTVIDITDAKAALDAAAAAQDKADQAFIDAGEALEAAGLAQEAADGAAKVYYTATAPSGIGHPLNSIWFRQEDNKIHIWDGDSWEPRADTDIAAAKLAATNAGLAATEADGKAVLAQEAADDANLLANAALPRIIAGASQKTFLEPASINVTGAAGSIGKLIIVTGIPSNVGYMCRIDVKGFTWNSAAGELDVSINFYITAEGALSNHNYTSLGSLGVTGVEVLRTADNKVVLALTSANGAFNYIKASVTRALVGHNMPADSVGTGWSMSIGTDLSAYTPLGTISITRDLNDSHSLTQGWRTTGTVTIDGGKLTADSVTALQIAANTITATQIAADAITASKIKAGEITAAKLVAGTLTSASGVFGDINANIITSGTINTARLNAGEIRAAILLVGKITASDMVTNTITAASGIIGSLDISKVTTGTMSGIYITAKTLSAEHVVISRGANLYTDPDIQDTAFYSVTSYLSTTGGKTGKGSILIPTSATQLGTYYAIGTTEPAIARRSVVVPGSNYRVGVWVRTATSAPLSSISVYARCYKPDGSFVFGVPTNITNDGLSGRPGVIATGVWTWLSGMIAVPEDCTSVSLGFYKQANYTTGAVRFSDPAVQQAAAGELIVDGSITGVKVDAQSVAAVTGQFININVSQLNATSASMGQAVIDKLWSDVVSSRKITTDMLVVTSGTNTIVDPMLEDEKTKTLRATAAGSWGGYSRSTGLNLNWYGGPLTAGTSRSFFFDAGGAAYDKNTMIAVQEGQQWILKIKYTSNVSGPRATVRQVSADGVTSYTAAGWTTRAGASNAYGPPGTGVNLERVFTVPAGVTHIIPAVQFEQTCTSAYVYGGASLIQMVDANLVVNGGIIAEHITASEAMWTKVLGAHLIMANEVNTNSLSSDTAFIGQMKVQVLSANSINATMLQADAITAKHSITGALFQTETTASRGVKISPTLGLKQWDDQGNVLLSIGGTGSTGNIMVGTLATGTGTNQQIRLAGNYDVGEYPNILFCRPGWNPAIPADEAAITTGQSGWGAITLRAGKQAGGTARADVNIFGPFHVRPVAENHIPSFSLYPNTATGYRAQAVWGESETVNKVSTVHYGTFGVQGGNFIVTNGSKNFRMDHPLDDTKYLLHADTESPVSGVEYWGTDVVSEDGTVVVMLPDYFEALTKSRNRSTLVTPQGAHVTWTDIEGNSFIVSGEAGTKFSWLVKAERYGADFDTIQDKETGEDNG